ncbi:orexin/Hypocretin receptor type 1 [Cylas formicarius]|uniref:orexin/Hypocretin receptor type 1 n=1 Tax=Cylas formicarius TaxID=197179 RepID=UPI002958A010|nr:orexin/Hypocretin receptor type 1 [Cylas formicarius]
MMAPENETFTLKDHSDVPPYIWEIAHQLLLGVDDKKLDLREPQPKKSLESAAAYIIFVYGLLAVYGVFSNLMLFVHILRYRLYKDPTFSFIINNVVSDVMKCVVVLPMTLYVLLVQNWMLGELLCTFLPMIQDIPLHVTMLTYVFLSWDRYRYLRHPTLPRLPAFVCTIGSWLTSVCLVLPYPIYITHIDLGMYVKDSTFDGVSICVVNLTDDMKEYMRGIFLVTYAGPLAAISYFFVCSSRELAYHSNAAAVYFDSRTRGDGRSRTDSNSTVTATTTDLRSSRGACSQDSRYSTDSYADYGRTRYETHEPEVDVVKEKRTQYYLGTIITVNAVCLCPLMIMRLARVALSETYDNSSHFDYTYVIFVWVGFLPTCVTPLVFTCWQMSRSSKKRLKGYFRFSNRKLRHSCEMVVTSAGTPASRLKIVESSDRLEDVCQINRAGCAGSSFC